MTQKNSEFNPGQSFVEKLWRPYVEPHLSGYQIGAVDKIITPDTLARVTDPVRIEALRTLPGREDIKQYIDSLLGPNPTPDVIKQKLLLPAIIAAKEKAIEKSVNMGLIGGGIGTAVGLSYGIPKVLKAQKDIRESETQAEREGRLKADKKRKQDFEKRKQQLQSKVKSLGRSAIDNLRKNYLAAENKVVDLMEPKQSDLSEKLYRLVGDPVGTIGAGIESAKPKMKNFLKSLVEGTGEAVGATAEVAGETAKEIMYGGIPSKWYEASLGTGFPGSGALLPYLALGTTMGATDRLIDYTTDKIRSEKLKKRKAQLKSEFDKMVLEKSNSAVDMIAEAYTDKLIKTSMIPGALPSAALLATILMLYAGGWSSGYGMRRKYDPGRQQEKLLKKMVERRKALKPQAVTVTPVKPEEIEELRENAIYMPIAGEPKQIEAPPRERDIDAALSLMKLSSLRKFSVENGVAPAGTPTTLTPEQLEGFLGILARVGTKNPELVQTLVNSFIPEADRTAIAGNLRGQLEGLNIQDVVRSEIGKRLQAMPQMSEEQMQRLASGALYDVAKRGWGEFTAGLKEHPVSQAVGAAAKGIGSAAGDFFKGVGIVKDDGSLDLERIKDLAMKSAPYLAGGAALGFLGSKLGGGAREQAVPQYMPMPVMQPYMAGMPMQVGGVDIPTPKAWGTPVTPDAQNKLFDYYRQQQQSLAGSMPRFR